MDKIIEVAKKTTKKVSSSARCESDALMLFGMRAERGLDAGNGVSEHAPGVQAWLFTCTLYMLHVWERWRYPVQSRLKLTSGCKAVDEILGGGIETGSITEVRSQSCMYQWCDV